MLLKSRSVPYVEVLNMTFIWSLGIRIGERTFEEAQSKIDKGYRHNECPVNLGKCRKQDDSGA